MADIVTAGSTVIDGVTVIAGDGAPVIDGATVVLDGDGIVTAIEPGAPSRGLVLQPAAVDLHLDNLRERRRPRATVELDHAAVIAALDAECAAAGIGVVCISARCEHSPGNGVLVDHAVEVAAAVEVLAPTLACDWRIHARVEVTDDSAVTALEKVLSVSSRVVLASVMEHSADRNRFASLEEHRQFYAADWGVSVEDVDEILAAKRPGAAAVDDRRRAVAAMAADAAIPLASHDDRHVDDVEAAFALGARVAEFPLTIEAARHAQSLGMATVLGAPNAVRGRSTSPGNLLVGDAVAAGVCDVLCSDYLPASLAEAPHALAAAGACDLSTGVDLIGRNPALALGLPAPRITVGEPLTATLRARVGDLQVGVALWRQGRKTFDRQPRQPREPRLTATE